MRVNTRKGFGIVDILYFIYVSNRFENAINGKRFFFISTLVFFLYFLFLASLFRQTYPIIRWRHCCAEKPTDKHDPE